MGYLNKAGLERFYTGLKGKFLLQSNVANALNVTAAGKALDARQGKTLNELIASNQAAALSGILSSPTYTHAKTGTNHNFVGTGRLGYAILTADYADGDTISVNGTAVTVYGDKSALTDGSGIVFTISGGVMYLYAAASEFSIPDGDTVMTLNDAGIWLSCAGVNPATAGNPTISQLVASQSYCETLMNSANAVNYMIRSTIIQTAVLGSATALAALDASSPFVSVEMTSNSAPTGYTAEASYAYGEYLAYRATTAAGCWMIMKAYAYTPYTCDIQIPNAVWPYRFQIGSTGDYNNGVYAVTLKIQGSNDGTTWADVSESITTTPNQVSTFLPNTVAGTYRKYRINILSSTNAQGSIMTGSFKIYGKQREV